MGVWGSTLLNWDPSFHFPSLLLPWRHYFADVSIFRDDVIKNPTKTKNPITSEPLIVWKWLTPRWKGIIRPHSKNKDWPTHYADFLMTSALFGQIFQKWRHVTSRDVIMSDFHQTFRKCFFYWYYDCVQIWSHLHHLNGSYEQLRFFRLIWKYIGKSYLPPTKHPYLDF